MCHTTQLVRKSLVKVELDEKQNSINAMQIISLCLLLGTVITTTMSMPTVVSFPLNTTPPFFQFCYYFLLLLLLLTGERKQSFQFTVHTESSWNRRPDYVVAAQSEREMKEWISAFKVCG